MMSARSAAVSALAVASLVVLAGCAGAVTPPADSAGQPTTTAPLAPEQPSAPSAPATPTPGEPCENLITPGTVALLKGEGWSYREQPFRIISHELAGGVYCIWGDETNPSDHVQIYGAADVSAEDSAALQQELLDQGWKSVDEAGRVLITEDPQFAFSLDDEGFGMTYEFGDGWVKVSDTKQGLVLVTWPLPE